MTFKPASQIAFGIEIECNIPNECSASFPKGTYHHGLSIPVAPSAGWNCQKDGSVNAGDGYFPAEIVSPKLRGEAGLVEVVQMLDLLDSINARVNNTCGLHVHVSVEGLDQNELNRVVKLFKAFEMAFYSLNGDKTANRLSNHYCKPSAQWSGDRYASLNLQNVSHGHVEIRVWSGNLKPEVVVAAIYMATALVSRATNPEPVKTSHLRAHNYTLYMGSFIQQFVKGDSMIVNDLDPADVFQVMMKEAVTAKTAR